MAMSSELEQLLAEWLPRQSWFPVLESELGSDPDLTPMSDTLVFELDLPLNHLGGDYVTARGTVAIVAVGEGDTLRRVNVPLTFRTVEDEPLRPHLIGKIDDFMLGPCWVYDAVADPLFVLFAATAMGTGNAEFALGAGAAFSDLPAGGTSAEVEALPGTAEANSSVETFNSLDAGTVEPPSGDTLTIGESKGRQLTAAKVGQGGTEFAELQDLSVLWQRALSTQIELANSRSGESMVVIEDHAFPSVITFFRVLGVTPDRAHVPESVRLPVLLTEAESHAVPPVLGWLAARWFDGHDLATHSAPVAMLTHNEPDSRTAWTEAVEAVVQVDSASVGSYNRRGSELGHRIGELHLELAVEFGLVESIGAPTTEWVEKWSNRIDWALARAPLALGPLATRLRKHQKSVRTMATVGSLQRIHGGLTLNQVRKSPVGGYTVVNFADDSEPKPPAFDLVALLRSLDYAAGYARLVRTGALDPEAQPSTLGATGLVDEAERDAINQAPETLWSRQAQNALLSGYAHTTGTNISFQNPVLRAILIDRILVEVVTELRNRPAWLVVPLSALTSILVGDANTTAESAHLVAPAAPESTPIPTPAEPPAPNTPPAPAEISIPAEPPLPPTIHAEAAEVHEPEPEVSTTTPEDNEPTDGAPALAGETIEPSASAADTTAENHPVTGRPSPTDSGNQPEEPLQTPLSHVEDSSGEESSQSQSPEPADSAPTPGSDRPEQTDNGEQAGNSAPTDGNKQTDSATDEHVTTEVETADSHNNTDDSAEETDGIDDGEDSAPAPYYPRSARHVR